MELQRRWLNRHQPQTLLTATMLLYLEGLFSLLRGSPILLLVGLLMFPSAYLIANDRRIGWKMAVTLAAVGIIDRIRIVGPDIQLFLALLFPTILLCLLLHPMSREHQRHWFH